MGWIPDAVAASLVSLLAWLARYPALQFWRKSPPLLEVPRESGGDYQPVTKAIYTYIIGDYDLLKEPDVRSKGWDYLCYSDTPRESRNWTIHPVDPVWASGLSPKQTASLLKIEHYRFAPDNCDLVITIDGSMQIHADLDRVIDLLWEDGLDMVIAEHPKRDCVYREAVAVLQKDFDAPTKVCPQVWRYFFRGYPAANGMYGTRMMIKNNRSDNLRRMCETWSMEYRRGSCRDQLSLNFAIWQTRLQGIPLHIKAVDFNWLYRESGLFGIRQHKG
jgi:hypothetical protein